MQKTLDVTAIWHSGTCIICTNLLSYFALHHNLMIFDNYLTYYL